MANLPVNKITVAGTAPTFAAAAAGGDLADVGNTLFLVAKNVNASPRTLTIAAPGNLETGDAYPDRQYTLAATTGEQWIPLVNAYRDPLDGKAHISYSSEVGVTVAVVER